MIDMSIEPHYVESHLMTDWLYNKSLLPHKTKGWNESFISTDIVMTQHNHSVYAVTNEGIVRNISIMTPNKQFKAGYVYIIERYVLRINEAKRDIPDAMLSTVIDNSFEIVDNVGKLKSDGNVVIHRVYPIDIRTIRLHKQVRVKGLIISLILPTGMLAPPYKDDGTVTTTLRIVDNINPGTKYYYKAFKAVNSIYSVYDNTVESGIYLTKDGQPIPLKAHDSVGIHLSRDKAYLDDKVEVTLEQYKLDMAKIDLKRTKITAEQIIELNKAKIILSKLNIEAILVKLESEKNKSQVESYKSIKETTKEVGGIIGTIKKVIDVFI